MAGWLASYVSGTEKERKEKKKENEAASRQAMIGRYPPAAGRA